MIQLFVILILSGVAALGQTAAPAKPADPLAALQADADTKTAEWETLATGMEASIGRMLPCDPRVRATIEEARRASEARLLAFSQALKAAVDRAKADTEAARAAATRPEAADKDLETERAEANQERIAIEGQIADLSESVRKRTGLEAAQTKLTQIAAMVRERAEGIQQFADNKNTLAVPLKNLLAGYETRQAALEAEQAALAEETSRWSDYYTARLARAQTECSIINQADRRKK